MRCLRSPAPRSALRQITVVPETDREYNASSANLLMADSGRTPKRRKSGLPEDPSSRSIKRGRFGHARALEGIQVYRKATDYAAKSCARPHNSLVVVLLKASPIRR